MNLTVSGAVAAGAAAICAAFMNLAYDLATPRAASLSVAEFSFDPEANAVTQRLALSGSYTAIQATWAARVDRPGMDRALCEGSGTSVYTGQRAVLPLARWASPECPPLQPGDVLRATWAFDGGQVSAVEVVR